LLEHLALRYSDPHHRHILSLRLPFFSYIFVSCSHTPFSPRHLLGIILQDRGQRECEPREDRSVTESLLASGIMTRSSGPYFCLLLPYTLFSAPSISQLPCRDELHSFGGPEEQDRGQRECEPREDRSVTESLLASGIMTRSSGPPSISQLPCRDELHSFGGPEERVIMPLAKSDSVTGEKGVWEQETKIYEKKGNRKLSM
jgi:hypothetical protein